MLLRAILGLGLVFANLPPVDPPAGEPQTGASQTLPQMSSSKTRPLPGHAIMEKVREFCLAHPVDCVEIAGAVTSAGANAASYAPVRASRDTLTQADRSILPIPHDRPAPRVTHH